MIYLSGKESPQRLSIPGIRFHPDNRVMWFGDQVWRKCDGNAEKAISGEEATQKSDSGSKADHETGSQGNLNCSEREINRANVYISSEFNARSSC